MVRVATHVPRGGRLAAAVCALLLILSSCSTGAATSSAELGSPEDEVAVPTAVVPEVDFEPGVIIEPTPTPEGPRPLLVATVLGETGVMETLDGPALAGVMAEIDRLNDAGGVLGRTIELRRFDTQSRTSLAQRFADQLVAQPPDLIITSCDTDFSTPVLDAADEAGLLTISPCADDVRYLTGAMGSRNFTMGAPPEPRGALAARIAFERYGPTAIVLRDVTSPEAIAFCDGFERAFRELGGSVVYRDEFRYDTLEPVQDRLAERDRASSFIVVCSHAPGGVDAAPSLILNLRTLGFQAPIVAGSSVDSPDWFGLVPTLGELTFVSWSSAYGNDPDDRINEVVDRAQDLIDPESDPAWVKPGVSTILGAEAVEAWARSVEAVRDPAPERVVTALGSFNDETFATGDISFVSGARMDIGRVFRILEVVAGELSVVALESTPN